MSNKPDKSSKHEQIDIFDVLRAMGGFENAVTPKKLKMISLFSGIGAFEKALDRLGIPYELIGYCEIDKYASKSYSAIHNVPESMNFGDITQVDEKALPKNIDLITYGFPCQDISNAGKMKGLLNADGTRTRSGLFFEAARIIEATKPRVAIAENVKMLTSKKFATEFKIVLDTLRQAGYNNYWKVLNAKKYGIPQNRERVFIVSIRKDIYTGFFKFPEPFPLEKRLKDVLEEAVEEKYFVKDELTRKLVINQAVLEPQVLRLVRSEHGKRIRNAYESGDVVEPWSTMKQYEPRVDGVSNTISTVQKDNYLLVREATKAGCAVAFVGDSINFEQPNSQTRRGRVGKQMAQTLTTSPQQGVVINAHGTITTDESSPKHNNRVIVWDGFNQRVRADQSCVGTLTQNCGADLKRNGQGIIESNEGNLRIRNLTPKECFRLMGFDDADFEKAEAVNSNNQLYKQAGNSIVVPVVEYIIKALHDCGVWA